ncbi:MAG: hypothetical protein U0793_28535 [Gemmataceae bacterium]
MARSHWNLACVALIVVFATAGRGQEPTPPLFQELEAHRLGITWGKGEFSPQDPPAPRAQVFRSAAELAHYLGLKEPKQIPVAIAWERQTLVLFRWTARGGDRLTAKEHDGAIHFIHEPEEGPGCYDSRHTCVHIFAVRGNVPWTWFTIYRTKDDGRERGEPKPDKSKRGRE